MAIDALNGVAESAAIGVPHADFGEGVIAVVVATAGSPIQPEHIAAALTSELAAFKRPKKILLVDELPRNAMGKVQKAELRALYKDTFATASA